MPSTSAGTAGGVPVRAAPPVLNGAVLAGAAVGGPLLASLLAWLLLIAWSRSEGGLALCIAPGPSAGFAASIREQTYLAPPARQMAEWSVMVVAMMAPLAVPALVQVSARCFRNLRVFAVLLALGAYLAVWVVIGPVALALTVLARAAGAAIDAPAVPVLLAGAGAVAWCWSRARIGAGRRCHAIPALSGPPVRIVLRSGWFGLRLGLTCLAICGPAMLALSIAGAGLIPMVAMTHILLAERLAPAPRPKDAATGLGLVLLGACLVTAAG